MTGTLDGMTQSVEPGRRRARALGVVVVLALLAGLLGVLAWTAWHHRSTSVNSSSARTSPLVYGSLIVERGAIGTPRPLVHVRLIVAGSTATGLHITHHVVTNRLGRFQLQLPAGHYVVAVGRKLRVLIHQTHVWITVTPHRPVYVRIVEASF